MNKNDTSFEQWFAEVSSLLKLHKDINHPSNRDYDYVAAYYSGLNVPKPGQELPSEFKGDLSGTRYIPLNENDLSNEFFDSKLNQVVGVQDKMVQDVRRQEREENFLDQD